MTRPAESHAVPPATRFHSGGPFSGPPAIVAGYVHGPSESPNYPNGAER